MRKRDEYKHLLNGISNCILLALQTAIFAVIWYEVYVPGMKYHFFRRGNWAVIGIYTLFVCFFTQILGGYRIGYLRITDICLSQILSILCANAIGSLLRQCRRLFSAVYGGKGLCKDLAGLSADGH